MNNKYALLAAFTASSALTLVGCSGVEPVNPYASDTPSQEITIAKNQSMVTSERIAWGNYAEFLSDGAHIITYKSRERPMLIIKDDAPSHFRGHAYFGITNIEKQFIPDREPDMDNDKISTWTVHVGDLIENNMKRDGVYIMTIPGMALNGQDLKIEVFKDNRVDGLKEYSYLGIDALPAPEPQ